MDQQQQQQQVAVQGGGPNGGGLSATERAILSEWARGVEVTLFSHARLQQGNAGWGSSSGGLEESGGRLKGAVVEAAKASSRPRKVGRGHDTHAACAGCVVSHPVVS